VDAGKRRNRSCLGLSILFADVGGGLWNYVGCGIRLFLCHIPAARIQYLASLTRPHDAFALELISCASGCERFSITRFLIGIQD